MSRRPRLLLTTDLLGGVWDFCLALAQSVDAEVTLLALGAESAAHRRAALAAGAAIIFAPLKLEWMRDAEADIAATGRLIRRLIGDVRPDVVHANQFAAVLGDPVVPTVLTVHSDVLSWRRATLGGEGVPAEWQSYARLVRQALRSADRICAVSSFLANEVRDLYGCSRDIEVIHNGWPAPSAAPQLQVRSGTVLAGRVWDSAKNIQLAATAAQGWEPGPVYVAGDQQHPESGALMPLDPPLRSLGYLPRAALDELLARARLYLSPARYDPFGLLPLQAALHGATLLLSDIPSYRELWAGAACFFRSDDAADLARQWQHLLQEPEACAALAQAARARAAERFTIETMASAYQRAYVAAQRSVAA